MHVLEAGFLLDGLAHELSDVCDKRAAIERLREHSVGAELPRNRPRRGRIEPETARDGNDSRIRIARAQRAKAIGASRLRLA